ncbi:NAD(P)-dependent alcohol dehydrogenase [Hoyosella subflava]|uniref:Alcohol dehydrogenase zinc-binding domain protein n=1 Tax=Hoyosella subflava (strain DSM 45089 / JCM 17490 / NBRC 109087 / DQS3-9A1) TaxID=443218 RepID=F6EI49_HOYSD|nr:NAD(P)-dependent alcohol dehydrogenase [Hoyosella subflava]AEF41156.1 Alcohol dehydrogenase zinc-binding domain protein [Hoyosella subflava DQS3-9A1]
MKAAVYDRYGPPEVMRITDVDKPTPRDDEILVKVYSTTVTAGDYRVRTLDTPAGFRLMSRIVFGVSTPRKPILGSELAGDVASVGKDVRSFAVGDAVVAFTDAGLGCHAEYRCVPESGIVVRKPQNLTYEQSAALCFGGTTALHFLRKAKLKAGERVLVNGASGAVGTACVQLAHHLGAEVTGVCSTANIELVRSLGATHVVDYTREDFVHSGQTYDVIIDVADTARFALSKRALTENGRLLLVSAPLAELLKAPFSSLLRRQKVIGGVALGRLDDVQQLVRLAEEGVYTPVIDRTYAFADIVEAHRYVATRRKKGNVVLVLDQ